MANKNHGKIHIGGTIHVEGPDLLRRLAEGAEVTFEEENMEFYLKVKNAAGKDSLKEITPWIALYKADVEITNDVNYDDEPVCETFGLMFKGKDGRRFDLHFSIDQARVAAEFLNAYVRAHDSQASLKRSVPVQGLQEQAS